MLRRRLSRSFGLVTLSVVSLFALAIPLSAQNYGLGDQILTVGALAFRPRHSTTVYDFKPGSSYLYGGGYYYDAPLVLPDGAQIFQICLYADVPGGRLGGEQALVDELAPGGFPTGEAPVDGSQVIDNIAIGAGVVCTDPGFSYVFHDDADVDGDQISEHVAHYVEAHMLGSAGLGGLRIAWRRHVSPAPAQATFGDVPTDHPFFQFIEALRASGITQGCQAPGAPPIYCPDTPVSRGQMAAFLARALGLHFPN